MPRMSRPHAPDPTGDKDTKPRTQKTYIGIDNGVSGTISFLSPPDVLHVPIPIRSELNYTKEKKHINRLNFREFKELLRINSGRQNIAIIERPMVNPGRFAATISAVRCLEAILITLEGLGIPHQYIDSREWQKAMLPHGLKGPELKKAAVDVARRLFPQIQTKDADALLIAEYARRKGL